MNNNTFHILVEEEYGTSRDQLCDIFWKENIMARRYYHPGCHRMSPFRKIAQNSDTLLPVTEKISDSILCLPCFPSMADDEIKKVVDVLHRVYEMKDIVAAYYLKNTIDPKLN